MGSIGIWQVVIIGVIVVLLFGRGKISELMGDVAKGIKSFKKGLVEEDSEVDTANTIEHSETPAAEPVEKKTEAS
jgi:sec-independent protein translocase protein TatA